MVIKTIFLNRIIKYCSNVEKNILNYTPRRKSKIFKEVTIIFSNFNNIQKIINKKLYKTFLKLLHFKAYWEKPVPPTKQRYLNYFLKNGEVVKFIRLNKVPNFLWKFKLPLKYAFYKFLVLTQRKKQKDLERLSNKWKMEELPIINS